jgi:hypothetical protein
MFTCVDPNGPVRAPRIIHGQGPCRKVARGPIDVATTSVQGQVHGREPRFRRQSFALVTLAHHRGAAHEFSVACNDQG